MIYFPYSLYLTNNERVTNLSKGYKTHLSSNSNQNKERYYPSKLQTIIGVDYFQFRGTFFLINLTLLITIINNPF